MSNIFTTIWTDIEGFVNSTIGETVDDVIATGFGVGSAIAVIEEANPSNKGQTASDVLLIAGAATTLLSGTSAPTLAQTQAIFAALKASDSVFQTLANTLATSLYLIIQKYDGTPWVKVAQAYINGWTYGAYALGGAAPAAAPSSTSAATS